MGAWGPGIFSNDLAADVRSEFRELIEDGLSGPEATSQILTRYAASAADPDEATAFWTGLAATQSRLGRLETSVRDRAIQLIDQGGDIHLATVERDKAKRRTALLKLKGELLGPVRSPIKVRRPRPIPSPVEPGQLVGLPLSDGREARLRVVGMETHRLGRFPIVELVDLRGKTYRQKSIREKWDDPARFEIIPPRLNDLPRDLHVIESHGAVPASEVRVSDYTNWTNLRGICARLLDTPEAAPD